MIKLENIQSLVGNHVSPYIYNAKEFKPGTTPIYYSGPYWDNKETEAAIDSFLNGKWVTAGEKVHKFENAFSKRFNTKYSHMVNSGSSANLVLIAALKKRFGWSDGDEIIVSPVGFATTISVLYQNRLKPVFIDIEWDTLNFDTDLIESKITSKTKGIFISPVLGNPPDMDILKEIADKYGILLIGDNCDSLGSKWNGKYLSDYYVAYSNSFYPAHHISTGEGGMICSNDAELKKLFMSLSTWGRECHPAGTSIYTTAGVKNIEDVAVDDIVYTHNGNYERVYELMKRDYSGKLLTIKSMRNQDVVITENHPLYIKRGNEYMWALGKDIIAGDFLTQKIPSNFQTPKTLSVSYKTLFDERSFEVNCEPDLFRLIGYWLAEGSANSGKKGSNGNREKDKNKYLFYKVEFAFNVAEEKYISDVTNLMKKYFGVSTNVRSRKGSNGVSLTSKSRRAYEFFIKYCNKISYNKKLLYDFIHYDKELLAELVKGYWRGDGSHDFQSTSVATTSIDLANQIRLILSRFDISPSILIRDPKKHTNAIVNGRVVAAKRNLYSLTCYGENSRKLNEILGIESIEKKKHTVTKYRCDCQDYILHEVQNILIEDVNNITVYNFEVENDHSYHANGIASHNCYCVGSANLLPCGTCGNRFDKWLEGYDGIIDHKYVFSEMGYNLKPLDLQGAIGLVQLEKLPEIEANRKRSHDTITEIFKSIQGIRSPSVLPLADPCWFGTPFICEEEGLKARLVAYLEANKIQTRNYFAGNILMHPGYSHLDDVKKYPEANKVLDKVFFIGAAPHYTEPVFDYIEDVIRKFK